MPEHKTAPRIGNSSSRQVADISIDSKNPFFYVSNNPRSAALLLFGPGFERE
jgi:hypothetical protein